MILSVTTVLEPSRTARICRSETTAAITGLAVTWGGTALLVSPAARGLGDPSRLPIALVGQALFWALGGLGGFTFILSARGLWGLRRGQSR